MTEREIKSVLVVGNYRWLFYEQALREGFEELGVCCHKHVIESWAASNKIRHPIQLWILNRSFLRRVINSTPDVLFLYRTNELFPSTLIKIKKLFPELTVCIYHNDNPYVNLRERLRQFFFLRCIKHCDITYVYRPSNIPRAESWGGRRVSVLMPHYYSRIHCRPTSPVSKDVDLVFIGHYEIHRAEHLFALLEAGVSLRIYGPGWSDRPVELAAIDEFVSPPVYGGEYCDVISRAKLAICFLSKKNHDVYTRRNFEVPAIGTVMVSEYTEALASVFREGVEALFFRDKSELLRVVSRALENDSYRDAVANAGFRRVVKEHSELARCKQIIADVGANSAVQ